MRSGLLFLAVAGLWVSAALAQQNQPAASQTAPAKASGKTKKADQPPVAEPSAAAPEMEKPSRESSSERDKDRERDKDPGKDSGKEEHFDVSEVAPVVTHHQMMLGGKALKYTATT